MEISWDFVFFNGVYRSFLIFWKFINYCWFYRRDANWNHLYFSSPWDLIHHLEFLFGVCVCAWKGKHACSIASWHPHKITDVQLYHMHWYVMIYAMIVQMAAVPLRGACKYFQSVADMKKKANVKDIRLSAIGLAIFWRIFGFWNCHMKMPGRPWHSPWHHGVLVKDF